MRDFLVSGVPMRDPLGKYGIDYTASTIFSDASRAVSTDTIWGYHGRVAEVVNYFGSSHQTLVINVMGDTKAEHDQLLNGFQTLFTRKDFTVLSAPQRSPLAAGSGRSGRTFDVSSDLIKTALMCANGAPGIERINERTAKLTVILENIRAFWRSVNQYSLASVPLTTTPQTIDLTSLTADSTTPITAGQMRIKGPVAVAGKVVAYDRDTLRGMGFKATVALLATEYVIIDMETLKATKVTTDTWTGGTDFTARVELAGEGAFTFDPGEVVNFPSVMQYQARIVSSGITNGSTAVEFRLNRSYAS